MKVEDVMTRDVVSVAPETPLKEVAALLVRRGISGVPVVASDGELLGVVSETDILYKERDPEIGGGGLLEHLFHRGQGWVEQKFEARTAEQAMSSPAVSVRPGTAVSEAAALMLEREVNRLVVVDDGGLGGEADEGTPVGIVTRADFVRAFARPDEELAREIRTIIERQFWIPPMQATATVKQGQVTLEGEVDLEGTAQMLVEFVRYVPGVVSLESNLTWRREEAPEP